MHLLLPLFSIKRTIWENILVLNLVNFIFGHDFGHERGREIDIFLLEIIFHGNVFPEGLCSIMVTKARHS